VEGRIALFNEAAVELWGARPEPGVTRWCGSRKIYTADGEPLAPDAVPMAVLLREQRPVNPVEIIIERPDGSRRFVLAHPKLIRNDAGEVVGGQNMLVDVTEHKR